MSQNLFFDLFSPSFYPEKAAGRSHNMVIVRFLKDLSDSLHYFGFCPRLGGRRDESRGVATGLPLE